MEERCLLWEADYLVTAGGKTFLGSSVKYVVCNSLLLGNMEICVCCRSRASVFLYNRSVSLSSMGNCRAPCAVFSKHKERQEAQESRRTCRAWCVRGSSSVGLGAIHAWALGLYLCCSVSTFLTFSLRKLVARDFPLWAHRAVLWEV